MKSKKEDLKAFLLKILKEVKEKKNKKNISENLVPNKWNPYLPTSKNRNENVSIDATLKLMKAGKEFLKMQSLISEGTQIKNEMAMNIEDPEYEQPHPSVRSGIEGGKPTAFSDSEFFKGGQPDYSTLEKIGSDEFNKIIADIKPLGKMSMQEMSQTFGLLFSIEKNHIEVLEALAIKKVKEQFGLPDSVSDKLEAKLVKKVERPDEDSDNLVQDVEQDLEFTDEEKEIIKQHVEKRKIQNALMMGAGFRAHSTFNSIKEELDAIDPRLHPLYQRVMPNISLFMWKTPIEDMMGGGVQVDGISKLKKDENGNVKAEAQAIFFPILLHETAKAAIELLFANYLISLTDRYGANVASEIIKQADVFEEEIWMKRIGPTLWKYLHDVIDYIVKHDRGGDYTIVAHLLNKISLMEPNEFVQFMNDVVYDGEKTLVTLNAMIDEIEERIEAYEAQENETPKPEDIETGTEIDTNAIQDELIQLAKGAKEKQVNTPPLPGEKEGYEGMSLIELQRILEKAVADENFEEAAKLVPIIRAKNQG